LVRADQSSLNGRPFIGEFALSPRGFTLDVVLQSASSFLQGSYRLLGEEPEVRLRYGGLLWHRWYGLKRRGFLQW
jgi:hypothetical protein